VNTVFPGSIELQNNTLISYIWMGLIFGLVNALLRPLISFLTCPLIILTLGLFTLIINTLMFYLVGWIGVFISIVGKGIDTYIVDGLVNSFAWVTNRIGRSLRTVQTGRVQNYIVVLYLGALILVALGLFRIPHTPQTTPVPAAAVVPPAGSR
jgi:uncharacterized membrane protein YvlD (DUF360 family)